MQKKKLEEEKEEEEEISCKLANTNHTAGYNSEYSHYTPQPNASSASRVSTISAIATSALISEKSSILWCSHFTEMRGEQDCVGVH